MNLKTNDLTIEKILNKNEYIIPTFQRDYSWEKKHVNEFLIDIIKYIKTDYETKTLKTDSYFLGTMLFVKSRTLINTKEVIDGQQRLTTITILLSAISESFKLIGENGLSERTQDYIVFKDNNDDLKCVLQTQSSFPYFSDVIQLHKKNVTETSEEEENIKATFEYYMEFLSEKRFHRNIIKIVNDERAKSISYKEWLIKIRDQVLNSVVITIDSEDSDQANAIFEILNAKGKRLTAVDLIKNTLFTYIKDSVYDEADEKWKLINKNLTSKNNKENIVTFFRHYWASKYGKVTENKLYSEFSKKINKSSNKEGYANSMIDDLVEYSNIYSQILNPNIQDWQNRNEYKFLIQSIDSLENVFKTSSSRIPLLALIRLKKQNLVNMKDFRRAIIFLENFYMYQISLAKVPGSSIEKLISTFSIELTNSDSPLKSKIIIDEKLIKVLGSLPFNVETAKENFLHLEFSKNENKKNLLTKFILRKFHCYYSESDLLPQESSVEHIINENAQNKATLKIGNLILLEQKYNNLADSKKIEEKLEIYKKSEYKEVKQFLKDYNEFEYEDINDRSLKMFELLSKITL